MNTGIVTNAIVEKLQQNSLNPIIEHNAQQSVGCRTLPVALVKEISTKIDKFERDSYQTIKYRVMIFDSQERLKGNEKIEELKTILFELLKHIIKNEIVTSVELLKQEVSIAKYTLFNEVAIEAQFEVTTIFNID